MTISEAATEGDRFNSKGMFLDNSSKRISQQLDISGSSRIERRFYKVLEKGVEPSRVELLSKLDIDYLLIHRRSLSNPRAGTITYPRWWDSLIKS